MQIVFLVGGRPPVNRLVTTHPCMLFLYATYDCSRRFMKRLALHALRSSGVFALTRGLSARMARILMYHNFSSSAADPNATTRQTVRKQFQYLQRHFRVVPLFEIVQQIVAGVGISPYTVALTIDDGRHNCYEFFFPLLQEFDFPATFFVVSSFINGEDWLWTDKITWLSEQISASPELSLARLPELFKLLNRLRPEDRDRRIQTLALKAGVPIPGKAPPKYAPCSWSELRKMADSGLIEVGSHTVTHPILSSITDEESWHELMQSRQQIQAAMGREVKSFCFPNGMPEDYRSSQVDQLAKAGYGCAVVADFGLVACDANLYRLQRIGMGQKSKAVEIAKYLDGVVYYQQRLQRALGRPNLLPGE